MSCTTLRRIRPCLNPSRIKGLHLSTSVSSSQRKWSTPLARHLAEAIATTGPITLASYMRQCLTSTDGYYTRSRPLGLDPFGRSGDFVTSPEISQVFGELVGIWFVAEWMAQGRPQALKILELGPGRGTLMVDTLRALRNFKGFVEGLEGIHLVEASAGLRDVQRRALCGDESVLEEVEKGWMCRRSKYVDVPVFWYEDLRFVPNEKDKAPFIVAHEFFDALPIHAFQSVRAPPSPTITTNSWHPPPLTRPSSSSTQQWRELLVTTTPPSPITTTTTKTASPPPPEFHLLLSPHPTPHSLILPTLSPRYAALLAHPNSTIEICPDAHAHTRLLTSHLCTSARGAALLIDYGSTSTPISTLRGVRAHALTSPFSAPGEVDLSADVDFSALGEAARGAGGEVHGPVEQGAWLGALGGWERVEMLAGGLDTAEGERVRGAWKRLVDRGVGGGGGMGRVYKVLAITPPGGKGGRRPVGFGGGVVEEE